MTSKFRKKRKKIIKRTIFFLALLFLLILVSYFYFRAAEDKKQEEQKDILSNQNKEKQNLEPKTQIKTIKKTEKNEFFYTIEIKYPEIIAQENNFDFSKLNAALFDFVNQIQNEFEKELKTWRKNFLSEKKEESSLIIDYDVILLNSKALSVKFRVFEYLENAVHPSIYSLTFNYDIKKSLKLELGDLFSVNFDYLKFLSEFSRETLFAQLKNTKENLTDYQWLENGTAPIIDNFATFALSDKGLIIYFNPYQVAPPSSGISEILIPKDLIIERDPDTPLISLISKSD